MNPLWIVLLLVGALATIAWFILAGRSKPGARTARPAPERASNPASPERASRPTAHAPDALPDFSSEHADDDITVVAPLHDDAPAREPARAAPPAELEGPDVDLSGLEGTNPTLPFALILVSAIGQTDKGRKRKRNEDAYLALQQHHVFAVADGMGGHAAGDVASRLAVETLARAFESNTFEGAATPGVSWRGDELVRAVKMANAAVYAEAQANSNETGMGTTLVAARFTPNKLQVYIANVGDSRCYRLRERELKQITVDHNAAAHGVRGKGSQALTRAVGYWPETEVDLFIDQPGPGDVYVLCSDGLSKMLPDAQIADVIRSEPNLDVACQKLIDLANERGGVDNVTVVLVGVQPSPALAEH